MSADVWERSCELIKVNIDERSYKNWFVHTRFLSYEDGGLHVSVPSQFFADWLNDHYLEVIHESVSRVAPDCKSILFLPVPDETFPKRQMMADKTSTTRTRSRGPSGTRLNPNYNFDTFVVGSGNRFAHAASLAVADLPARAYNPLFLYGGVGLGKTHLMQAIGHYIVNRNSDLTVTYMSSEEFTNQLIDAIRNKSTMAFRNRYRKVDVLLIDDIHFIAGKESTQEELFHTFNALYDAHKQVVLSSDRPPKEIPTLEERLVSRFEWGLVTDIQPPDMETKVAILQKRAEREGFTVGSEVAQYIASLVTSNIRELEGALIKVRAYALLAEEEITLRLVEDVLRDLVGRVKAKQITPDLVQKVVADYYDVRIAELKGRNRQRTIAFPRQVAMYLCKELIPTMSLAEIGESFGGKDHATVIYACKKIKQQAQTDAAFRELLRNLAGVAKT
jgi:chromosomal replication initiator protein